MPDEPYCELQTTHFQRLAGEGSSFRDCISGYPLCSPYRAMLMSGRWPFQTGVVENAVQFPDDEISLGVTFRNAGYRTGYIGKWHLSPGDERGEFIPKGPARHGFEDWQVWSNTVHHFDAFTFDPDSGEKIERQGYSASLMTDAAVNFIGAFDAEPWMLVVSWGPPHPPFRAAPAETKQLYDPELLELRPNLPAKVPPILRQRLQGYYAHISALDKELGRLLHKLDETRQAERTIVVYTSDHGTMMGSQGLSGKRLPYDESCKVPFLIRYPVIAPGWRSKLLLSSIDLFPSLCGLAGLPVPAHCAGKDLSAAIRAGNDTGPESAFLMHVRRIKKGASERSYSAPLFRGVRTERFTYAVADDGLWCLYDNQEDPYQTRNLIGDPAQLRTTDELDELVFDWLRRAHDPFPLDALRKQRSVHH